MIYEIVLSGMNHKRQIEKAIENKLNTILEFAPSDSSASSYIKKLKNKYVGEIDIFSTEGRFKAKATGANLNRMVVSLAQQLMGQIKEWRNGRFAGRLSESNTSSELKPA